MNFYLIDCNHLSEAPKRLNIADHVADARCTVGELMAALADVFGRYRTAGLL